MLAAESVAEIVEAKARRRYTEAASYAVAVAEATTKLSPAGPKETGQPTMRETAIPSRVPLRAGLGASTVAAPHQQPETKVIRW